MALLFMDSFDHYATADLTEKWTAVTGTSGNMPTIGAYGRNGTNGLRIQPNMIAGVCIGLPASASGAMGFAMKCNALPGSTDFLATVYDGTGGVIHLRLGLGADGSLQIHRGDQMNNLGASWYSFLPYGSLTLLGSSDGGVIQSGVWAYIEWKWTIDDAAGSYEVRVNGLTVLTGTSKDTRSTNLGATTYSAVALLSNAGISNQRDFDDVYVIDLTGSLNNDFLGDVTVTALLPTGAGSATGWTPSTGSNYQCVDEASPNDDTDYVSASAVDTKDTYAFDDVPAGSVIKAVQVVSAQRKENEGPGKIKHVVRSSSADYDQAEQGIGGATYSFLCTVVETDPATSAAWTESGFNAAEFGVKKTG